MKKTILSLSLFCAFTIPAAAHADTLYTVTNGVLTSPYLSSNPVGSYAGTFTLSSNFTITSGSFTATVNGTVYNMLNFQPPPYNGAGYATFYDIYPTGNHLNFALVTSNPTPTLCTVALCGSGDTVFDTAVANNGMYNFSANGGTLTPGTPPSVTPEPSSLILLGTGAIGVAGALRRRLRRA